jgi:WXG100 family type VII secretion target
VSSYSVDPAALQQDDAFLADAVARCAAALSQVRGSAADLLGAGWQGAAASAFRAGWEHWSDGVTTMLEALDVMAAAVGGSGAGYALTDEGVRTALAAAT